MICSLEGDSVRRDFMEGFTKIGTAGVINEHDTMGC